MSQKLGGDEGESGLKPRTIPRVNRLGLAHKLALSHPRLYWHEGEKDEGILTGGGNKQKVVFKVGEGTRGWSAKPQ